MHFENMIILNQIQFLSTYNVMERAIEYTCKSNKVVKIKIKLSLPYE